MWEVFLAAGVPSAITGLLIWYLKKKIDKSEKLHEEQEKNKEQMMMIIINRCRANTVLAEATAKAVARIPDAKCNGDMKKALEEVDKNEEKEKQFILENGIQHIFNK